MAEKEKKKKSKKKQKQHDPFDYSIKSASDFSFKPTSDVKGLRFGGQITVKSFTIRRARPLELFHLLCFRPNTESHLPFLSTTAFLPTNFTILAHHAGSTLTLGLGMKKSKVVLFVGDHEESSGRVWPPESPLGEVNKQLIKGLSGCEMARFKFGKGCVTFYTYAVPEVGRFGFFCVDDLRTILQSVVDLKDFLDHTHMLAMPNQRSIHFAPPVAMAH